MQLTVSHQLQMSRFSNSDFYRPIAIGHGLVEICVPDLYSSPKATSKWFQVEGAHCSCQSVISLVAPATLSDCRLQSEVASVKAGSGEEEKAAGLCFHSCIRRRRNPAQGHDCKYCTTLLLVRLVHQNVRLQTYRPNKLVIGLQRRRPSRAQ